MGKSKIGGAEGSPTWEEVAHLLGERMKHQAHQCQAHTRSDYESHKDDCPFCADTQAYEIYNDKKHRDRLKEKLKNVRRDPGEAITNNGEPITAADIQRVMLKRP